MPIQIEFESNAEDVVSSFNAMGDAAAWLDDVDASGLEELADVSTELAEGLEDAGEAAEETAEALEDVEDATENANKKGKTFREAMKEGKQIMGAFNMVLGIGKAALDEVTASADRLGRTELGDNMDMVGESINDLKDNLLTLEIGGRDTIAWVSDAAAGLNNLVDVVSIAGIAWAQHTGAITDEEAAARAAALVTQDLTEAQIAQIDSTMATAAALEDARDQYDRAGNEATELALAEAAAREATELANDVYGTAASVLAASNLETATKIRLDTALKIASGELTIEEVARQQAVSNLTQAFVDGRISEQEYIDGMAELARQGELTSISLGNILSAINAIPDYKQIMIDVVEGPNSNYGNVVESANDNPFEGYEGTEGPNFASGTDGRWVGVPNGYPNDSYNVRMQSGEEFMVRQKGDTTMTTNNNWGGVTVVLPNVTNAQQFYAEMGRQADVRMRVG